jgi:hypothetical protein
MLGLEALDAGAALLYEESGGNPFYLEQLARASTGAARVALGSQSSVAELRVPAMVVVALSEELALLSVETLRVLQGRRAPSRWRTARSSATWPSSRCTAGRATSARCA